MFADRLCVGVAIVALLAPACSSIAAVDRRITEEAAIRALDAKWSATAEKNDVDGVMEFYADKAVLLAPNVPIATDAESIRESWAGLLTPKTVVTWKVTKVEVSKALDLGYLYGTYQLSMPDPKGGTAIHDSGKIVEVWKKQADGKWRCVVDTYNSDLPLVLAQ
jgi:ketosteroid isomerase-like protein